jgi:hypothetical protein
LGGGGRSVQILKVIYMSTPEAPQEWRVENRESVYAKAELCLNTILGKPLAALYASAQVEVRNSKQS